MIIKGINANFIKDSRGDKTILIKIKTNVGEFSASSPNGKSRGKYEVKSYQKDIESEIKKIEQIKNYFSKEIIDKFDDLNSIEDICDNQLGGNSIIALEYAILKGLSKEKNKEIFELINPEIKKQKIKIPRFVGNCIGGGKHSPDEKKPDFQEFHIIPNEKNSEKSFLKLKEIKNNLKFDLKKLDKTFKEKTNDEDAWRTSLNDKEILEILKSYKIDIGIDVASSEFYKKGNYYYKNPLLKRNKEEQLEYLTNLIKNFNIIYIEDPFDENDFESYSRLLSRFPKVNIVGDDLTTTNPKRLKKAIKEKSINSIIIKPNQIGSLIKVKEVCEIAKKNKINLVFSHRSGETEESILTDLCIGFSGDFLKVGITGKERECKIKRLIEIEKILNNQI
jgi:enolase